MITPIQDKFYVIKHGGCKVYARFLGELKCNYWGRTMTHYHFLKYQTNREVILKSRVKILAEVN